MSEFDRREAVIIPTAEFKQGALGVREVANNTMGAVSVAALELNGQNDLVRNSVSTARYFILSGSGHFKVEKATVGEFQTYDVKAGDQIIIPPGLAFQDSGNMELLAIYSPPYDEKQVEVIEKGDPNYIPEIQRHAKVYKKGEGASFERGGFNGVRVLETSDEAGFTVIVAEVFAGSPPKIMVDVSRNYYVLSGRGIFTLNGEKIEVSEGDFVEIPPGNTYSYEAVDGPMKLFEFNVPGPTSDSVRLVE